MDKSQVIIKKRLLDLGWSQTYLASRIGVSRRMVSHVIIGTRICWPIRRKIAHAINMPIGEIFPERPEERRKTA